METNNFYVSHMNATKNGLAKNTRNLSLKMIREFDAKARTFYLLLSKERASHWHQMNGYTELSVSFLILWFALFLFV